MFQSGNHHKMLHVNSLRGQGRECANPKGHPRHLSNQKLYFSNQDN